MGGRPVGAYVLGDGQVRWQPALDVNRAITVTGIVAAIVALAGMRDARVVAPLTSTAVRSRVDP
ncbi:hypothetical protein [Nocardia sp. NPDC003345]